LFDEKSGIKLLCDSNNSNTAQSVNDFNQSCIPSHNMLSMLDSYLTLHKIPLGNDAALKAICAELYFLCSGESTNEALELPNFYTDKLIQKHSDFDTVTLGVEIDINGIANLIEISPPASPIPRDGISCDNLIKVPIIYIQINICFV